MPLEVWEPKPPDEPHAKPTEHVCPQCGGAVIRTSVPCPDGRPGCCVLHWGLKCSKCGVYLREKA